MIGVGKFYQHFAANDWLNPRLFAGGRKFQGGKKILAVRNSDCRHFAGDRRINEVRNFDCTFAKRVGRVIAQGNEHFFEFFLKGSNDGVSSIRNPK